MHIDDKRRCKLWFGNFSLVLMRYPIFPLHLHDGVINIFFKRGQFRSTAPEINFEFEAVCSDWR